MNNSNAMKNAKIIDKIATGILYGTAGFFVLLLIFMTCYILYQGAIAIDKDSFGVGKNGIAIQLFNTVYLVFISLVITVPSGVFAGIYLSQYAKDNAINNFIRTCVETLSSLPSIVVGLFGYYVFVLLIPGVSWNLLAGSLALSILNIPLMTRVTEDAFSSIPTKYRDGSLALGGTKWQTIVFVLLPIAMPRIITGIILCAGRGFGEAAVLMYTSGMGSSVDLKHMNPFLPNTLFNPFRPADTLAVRIWALKTQGIAENSEKLADLSSAVLILLVGVFSLGSRLIGNKLEKKLK